VLIARLDGWTSLSLVLLPSWRGRKERRPAAPKAARMICHCQQLIDRRSVIAVSAAHVDRTEHIFFSSGRQDQATGELLRIGTRSSDRVLASLGIAVARYPAAPTTVAYIVL